jgi:hypothetical protein
VNHAARIEEAVSGVERLIGLAFDFPDDGAFHHVTDLIARMGMKADGGSGRQHRGAYHNFQLGIAGQIVPLQHDPFRLIGHRDKRAGEQREQRDS